MRWPWVSRTALELVIDERDRLRRRIDTLEVAVHHLLLQKGGQVHRDGSRIERPKPDQDPVPRGVIELINGFDNPVMREQQALEVAAARKNKVPWEEIEEALRNELHGPPEEPGAALGRYLDRLEEERRE